MTPFNIRDYGCSPRDLEVRYEKRGDHPTYTASQWRFAIREGAYIEHYWVWVVKQIALEREELERDNPYTQWEAECG